MNADQYRDDVSLLRRILGEARTIAVVGLSKTWHRPSNFSTRYMQEHGYRVIPVNPGATEILGETCYPSLLEVPEPIDIVDCFRKPSDLEPILNDAIEVGAKCFWMQLGVINLDVAAKAAAAGMDVVMDRCVKIEHARLFGGLNFMGVNTRVISSRRSKVVHN